MKKILFFTGFLMVFFNSYTEISHAWMKTAVISPIRVVIDKKKAANVKIINTSETETTFRIKMVSMEMNEKGNILKSQKLTPNSKKALEIIKYSPRRIRLKPGAFQTIRIMVRKTGDLPEGEYRSHLKIIPLPDQETKNKADKAEGVNVNINYLVSTSIPVIIRHGEISKNIKITNINIKKNKIIVSMKRTGKKSGLFDIEVLQKNKIIGKRERVAFYYPNSKLQIEIQKPDTIITGEEITIHLVDLESENKNKILDTFSSII